jgi:hypothetical protein
VRMVPVICSAEQLEDWSTYDAWACQCAHPHGVPLLDVLLPLDVLLLLLFLLSAAAAAAAAAASSFLLLPASTQHCIAMERAKQRL